MENINKVEQFLKMINIPNIKNQKFNLYGWEEGYECIPTENLGYIPFYDDKEMVIIKDFLEDGSPLKPSRMRTQTKYIVIHNTGMAHPSATAKGLNEYIHTTTRVASWHFSIDDYETYQELDLDEVGWHAGHPEGNNYGIGIESCVYCGVDFNKVMRRLAKLVANLLIKYNLDINDIRQHYDYTAKDCPQVIRHANRWDELIELINIELFAQTFLKGYKFEFKSLSPDVLNDQGEVINHHGESIEVFYTVKVTYNGEEKNYNFSSRLEERK